MCRFVPFERRFFGEDKAEPPITIDCDMLKGGGGIR
jgi:hypothetical protein